MKQIIVTISAYNESRNLGGVLDAISGLKIDGYKIRTVVVDDGSKDDTADLARKHGCITIRHDVNLGQGYAVLTGFKMALLVCGPDDIVIEMDGDGQHLPEEIPLFVDKLESGIADIVVGSRILGDTHKNSPFFRRTFLPLYTDLINRLTGYRLTDSMCGFRALSAGSLMKVGPILNDMLEPQYLAAEMFLRFSRAGLKTSEVPVHLKDRAWGVSSKGLVRYGLGVLKAIVKTMFDRNFHRMEIQ